MRGRVLVISESPEVGSVVTATLESQGFFVLRSEGDGDILHRVQQGGFDVLVVEARIHPTSRSLAFIRSIAAEAQHVLSRVVVITADASAQVERDLQEAGICDVVGKPVHADDIVAAVEACMDRTSATVH